MMQWLTDGGVASTHHDTQRLFLERTPVRNRTCQGLPPFPPLPSPVLQAGGKAIVLDNQMHQQQLAPYQPFIADSRVQAAFCNRIGAIPLPLR
jgi:hypothetical protein